MYPLMTLGRHSTDLPTCDSFSQAGSEAPLRCDLWRRGSVFQTLPSRGRETLVGGGLELLFGVLF